MRKNKPPVRFTGQHFTINRKLIADAIEISGIEVADTVLDIGAGKGHLTVHLAKQCRKVVAIENDPSLVSILRRRFGQVHHVNVVACDFRKYILPKERFVVLSNVPYGITSEILKALMFTSVACFSGGALIIQREAANKLLAEKVYNPYVVFYHTFFEIKRMYNVSPICFMPPPVVYSTLLQIRKRETCLIDVVEQDRYLAFLFFMLQKPAIPARAVLKKLFRKKQVREMAEKWEIQADRPVVYLNARQFAACFAMMKAHVPERFHPG